MIVFICMWISLPSIANPLTDLLPTYYLIHCTNLSVWDMKVVKVFISGADIKETRMWQIDKFIAIQNQYNAVELWMPLQVKYDSQSFKKVHEKKVLILHSKITCIPIPCTLLWTRYCSDHTLTLCSLSPHIYGLTQMIQYQCKHFIYRFNIKICFQRILTCHMHH